MDLETIVMGGCEPFPPLHNSLRGGLGVSPLKRFDRSGFPLNFFEITEAFDACVSVLIHFNSKTTFSNCVFSGKKYIVSLCVKIK